MPSFEEDYSATFFTFYVNGHYEYRCIRLCVGTLTSSAKSMPKLVLFNTTIPSTSDLVNSIKEGPRLYLLFAVCTR